MLNIGEIVGEWGGECRGGEVNTQRKWKEREGGRGKGGWRVKGNEVMIKAGSNYDYN